MANTPPAPGRPSSIPSVYIPAWQERLLKYGSGLLGGEPSVNPCFSLVPTNSSLLDGPTRHGVTFHCSSRRVSADHGLTTASAVDVDWFTLTTTFLCRSFPLLRYQQFAIRSPPPLPSTITSIATVASLLQQALFGQAVALQQAGGFVAIITVAGGPVS